MNGSADLQAARAPSTVAAVSVPTAVTGLSLERRFAAFGAALRRVGEEVHRGDPLLGAARLTLVLLVLYSAKYWDVRVPMAIFAAVGIFSARVARMPAFWLVIASVMVLGNMRRIFVVDNHQMLMTYWTVALTFCIAARSPEALRTNARLLIGWCFLFATLWKLISGDFMNGAFLQYTMLQDGRFETFARMFAGLTDSLILENRQRAVDVYSFRVDSVEMGNTHGLVTWGVLMAWHTILIEGAIALSFLAAPWVGWLARLRNIVLPLFLFTTYAIATVIGFGWLLAIMGYAQCQPHERLARFAYLAAFAALQVFLVPWSSLLGEFQGLLH